MSYNVDSADYIKGTGPLYMTGAAVKEALRQIGDDKPEGNFLDELDEDHADPSTPQKIRAPWWYGECSGNTVEEFVKALSLTTGTADILLTWEGGDSFSGYRVVNGAVTEHKVVTVLGDAVGG